MGLVLFFLALTFIGILLVITGIKNDLEGLILIGIFASIFGPISFIISSVEKDITSEWVETKVFHTKTPRLVVVDDGIRLWEFSSYEEVVNINDSTRFELEHTTNFWGTEKIEDIRIKK